MKLTVQKRLSSRIMKVGKNRVVFDTERLADIKEAITATDLRALIKEGAIDAKDVQGISKSRSRIIKSQKKKGRRKGVGSRKGPATARGDDRKRTWINKIRSQRNLLKQMRDEDTIEKTTYTKLYRKAKGGFFRSKRHLTLYIEEQGMMKHGK